MHGMTTHSLLHLTKTLAYLYFNQQRTCLHQNTSQTRLRLFPSTSPWSHEKSPMLHHYLQAYPRELSQLASLLSWSSPALVITRDAYFDKDISSALTKISKPFARAICFCSHLDLNGLQTSDNSQPSILHQTGSATNLDNLPSIFIKEPKDSEQPI